MIVSRRQALALFIFVAMVSSSACRKAAEQTVQVRIELEDRTRTLRVGHETVSLKLTDTLGKPVSGAHVSLEGNMSHAGMAPVFGQATEVAPGSYRGDVEFSMAGDWIITVRARLSDGQKVERHFEVKGVRSD